MVEKKIDPLEKPQGTSTNCHILGYLKWQEWTPWSLDVATDLLPDNHSIPGPSLLKGTSKCAKIIILEKTFFALE